MKLFKRFSNKPFCNDGHYFLIAVVLGMISLKVSFFFLFLCLFLLWIFCKTKLFLPIVFLLAVLFLKILFLQTIKLPQKEVYVGKIEDVVENGYILKINHLKVKVFDKKTNYQPGDVIECQLIEQKIALKSYEADFDYGTYLKSQGLCGEVKFLSSKKIKSGFSLNLIRFQALNGLKKRLSPNSYAYVSTLVFAQNHLGNELKNGYSCLGISHILAVSGLHIMLLYKVLCFLFFKVFHCYSDIVPLLILILYTVILGFPPACFRALLFLILSCLNQKGKISYTKLDILSISFIFMLILQPFQFYFSGFILSYLVSFLLIFMKDIFSSRFKVLSLYVNFIFIYFITFPVVSAFHHSISLSAFLFSPILSLMISTVVLPMTYLLAIFPFLDRIFQYLFLFLNEYITGLSQKSICLSVPSFSVLGYMVYYFLYTLVLIAFAKKKNRIRRILLFFFFMFLICNLKTVTFYHKITFIDVGQGDSALIELAYQKGTIVIDAFECVDYLKSEGIFKIDYLILTHSDMDHIKDVSEIMKEFQVKQILYPYYDDGFSDIKGIKVDYRSQIKINGYTLDVMAPVQEHKNKNSNSIVFRIEIDKHSFLFCGDMTIEEEKDIMDIYKNTVKSEVLKVGHHGSKTSTGAEFLDYVQPRYCVVSVGEDNLYGLPDKEVIERLEKNSEVYMTKNHGNICFYIWKNKMWLSTYR